MRTILSAGLGVVVYRLYFQDRAVFWMSLAVLILCGLVEEVMNWLMNKADKEV